MNPNDASAAKGSPDCGPPNVPGPSIDDPEILFMQETVEVLESFPIDDRRRILRWLVDRCADGKLST
jgi:hypothetical protein